MRGSGLGGISIAQQHHGSNRLRELDQRHKRISALRPKTIITIGTKVRHPKDPQLAWATVGRKIDVVDSEAMHLAPSHIERAIVVQDFVRGGLQNGNGGSGVRDGVGVGDGEGVPGVGVAEGFGIPVCVGVTVGSVPPGSGGGLTEDRQLTNERAGGPLSGTVTGTSAAMQRTGPSSTTWNSEIWPSKPAKLS